MEIARIADTAIRRRRSNRAKLRRTRSRPCGSGWRKLSARSSSCESTGRRSCHSTISSPGSAMRSRGRPGPRRRNGSEQRYRVVLIDEFQDTDPIQWEIVRRAFGSGGVTLVLVADPKQAIYAFRGADVYAYLEAAETASTRNTLRVNWRSDQGLIDAYDALFDDAKLGEEGILYRKVRAADANQDSRLSGAPESAPLRVRVVERGTIRLWA